MSKSDYLTKDYEGFKQLMLDLVPQLTPEWTDLSESDFGVVLIELLAHGLDILSYYQDKAFQESFIDTAQTKKSIKSLCRLLGYELKQPTPAKTTIVFKKYEDFLDKEITIHAGTQVGTSSDGQGEQIIFELDSDLIIPANALGDEQDKQGNYIYKVTATQGYTVYNSFLGVGDGTENQQFIIEEEEALLDSLELYTVENGVSRVWERVNDFLSSNPTSRSYVAFKDEVNNIVINFGDGITGLKLPEGALVYVNYRVGGGTKGNVGTNTITEFVNGEVVGIEKIFNPTGVDVLGTDEEDIEHARKVAPRVFRTMGRAVTKKDYEDIVLQIPGVAKSKAVETFNRNNDLYLYIVPVTYTQCTQALIDEVTTFINERKNIKDNVVVASATFKPFDLSIKIKVSPYYDKDTVITRTVASLSEALHPKNFEIGESIPLAYIFKEAMSVEGVQNVIIKNLSKDISCSESEILVLNNLDVSSI